MPANDYSSLTKEFPLSTVDQTIRAITPGMDYSELLGYAKKHTRSAIPGLIRKRFLLVDDANRVSYDEFLSLAKREGIDSALVRKVMLFVWAYRDDRIRKFIIERIANPGGRWSPTKLTNKANASFFAQGGAKARSNFEYFLVETGIYDENAREIHLELEDGWLEEAARVAAQHETDPEIRRRLLENPYKFLVDEKWHALANSTAEELDKREPESNFDTEPVEDESIATDPGKTPGSKSWNRKKPKASEKASTAALIDLVARERANQSHHAIEKALNERIRKNGHDPRFNESIDMFFTSKAGSVIVEVKSCTENNVHAQIRKGISQLLEYRYLHRKILTTPIHLALGG